MLRFFEDCIDLSEPDSERWVILGDLVSAFDQEGSSVVGNSIMWFLTAMNADSMVGFGPKTLWHGVQHAVRSFINLANRDRVVQDRLDVIVGGKFPEPCASAIAHWMALITAGKKLLPMILDGGSIWHMEGFDYDPDAEFDPAVLASLLYRAQARLWLGNYQPGQRFCGSCFLRSEGYMDEDVHNNGDFWSSVPMSFKNGG